MTTTPIRFAAVTKRFGSTVAVDAVTLQIEPGEMFFLLGPSGCGKTTLLRIVAGFTAPDGGEVFFGDRCVNGVAPQHRNCGMVFQSYALWPHMSVAENVAFGLKVRRMAPAQRRARVRDALELVHLAGLEDRKPGELSGGQQQRVALARALVIEPQCLLLDEPLSNLDAKLRVEMRSEIRRLCKQVGLTTIYVTHDQKEALSMADRVALMRDGAVVQCAPPGTLYRNPSTRFAADFLGETNFLSATIAAVDASCLTLETGLGQLRKPFPEEQCAAFGPKETDIDASQSTSIDRVSPSDTQSGALVGGQTFVVVGGKVTCSLRPESLRLGQPPSVAEPATHAAFEAEVLESTYLGESAQHLLSVAGSDLQLRVLEPNPKTAPVSATVTAWFCTNDLVLLAD